MSHPICPDCGQPMTGIRCVDGVTDGKEWGRIEPHCLACDQAQRPYPPLEAEHRTRIARRMSIRQAADALGMPPVLLSAYEMGREQAPSAAVQRMHALYGMDGDR